MNIKIRKFRNLRVFFIPERYKRIHSFIGG